MIRLLVLGVLVPAAISWAQDRSPIAEQNCRDLWSRFVWSNRGDPLYLQLRFRQAQSVSYLGLGAQDRPDLLRGKDKTGQPVKLTYLRSQLSSQAAVVKDEIDPAFFNDQYWLLFPLHLSWDSSAEVTETGKHKMPLGKGSASRVVVKYPSEGGYTPGDTWELFVGADNRIEEFIFHRGGSKKPTVIIASWGDYKKAGPLLVSLDHRGTGDGSPLRVFFSDVSVKLVGSNTWANAQ